MKKVRLSVLVVDDSSFSRDLLKRELVNYGCEIVGEAEDGIEAIKLYKSLNPDFVTMDIAMPELNGIEAIKEIKKIDKDAVILAVSAFNTEDKNNALIAGAVSFLAKPFQPSFLWNKIDEFVIKEESKTDDFNFKITNEEKKDESAFDVSPVKNVSKLENIDEDFNDLIFEVKEEIIEDKTEESFVFEIDPIGQEPIFKKEEVLIFETNPIKVLNLDKKNDEYIEEINEEVNLLERVEEFNTLNVKHKKLPTNDPEKEFRISQIIKEEESIKKEEERKKIQEERKKIQEDKFKISISPPRSEFYNSAVQTATNASRKAKKVEVAPVLNKIKAEERPIDITIIEKLKTTVSEGTNIISGLIGDVFKNKK